MIPNVSATQDQGGQSGTAPVFKAIFVGEDGGTRSNARYVDDDEAAKTLFGQVGALVPPYDPRTLALVYENSSSLRKNVDAYATNIDGFGHRFEPIIDLQANNADDRIRDALRLERLRGSGDTEAATSASSSVEPTDDEVAARRAALEISMRIERAQLEVFFDACTVDLPFSGPEGLRGRTRQDLESVGYGYWEVLRNGRGIPSQFVHLPPHTVRLLPLDTAATEVDSFTRTSPLMVEKTRLWKRFRRYAQVMETSMRVVYFKEYGDPRVVSSVSSKIYETRADLEKSEPGIAAATEIMEWKIYSAATSYGVPRWIGTLLSVLGNRESEESNLLYLENRSVPPLAILASGGRLTEESVSRLKDYITNEIRGKRNIGKIMILEAEAAGGDANNGRMKIELVPLTEAQQKDGLFQQYDERNDDKIGQAFRLPRLLRGDVRDVTRAAAEASLDFAEIQVFGPIREQFDYVMNKLILPELGIVYHRFRSNAPTVRDPQGLADMITKLVHEGVLTPEEARDLAVGVFNRELPRIRAPWTQQPLPLTLAGRNVEDNLVTPEDESEIFREDFSGAGAAAAAANATQQTGGHAEAVGEAMRKSTFSRSPRLLRQAQALVKLRGALLKAEADEIRLRFQRAAPTDVVPVPADIFQSFFAES